MLNFSKADLSDGAQEKVVAAADFRGPKPREARSKTDLFILPFIFLGLLFCCYCSIAPHITGEPGYYKLTYGTNYAGLFSAPAKCYMMYEMKYERKFIHRFPLL